MPRPIKGFTPLGPLQDNEGIRHTVGHAKKAKGYPSRKADAESKYYPIIKSKLEELFIKKYEGRLTSIWFEVTGPKRGFSHMVKEEIAFQKRDIIYHFIKSSFPDITGFIHLADDYRDSGFAIAEFKINELELKDIYQLKRYVDLFDARHGLLISLQPIPVEIKQLSKVTYPLLGLPQHSRTLTLATFDEHIAGFGGWFPEDPFKQ